MRLARETSNNLEYLLMTSSTRQAFYRDLLFEFVKVPRILHRFGEHVMELKDAFRFDHPEVTSGSSPTRK